MVNLTGTISLKKTKSTFSIHQLLIAFYLKTGVHEPLHPPSSTCYHPFSILHAEMLSCLILCRSHADKPQLMSALLLSYPEDTVLCFSSTTLFLKIFFNLLFSDFSLNLCYRMCYMSHLGLNSP